MTRHLPLAVLTLAAWALPASAFVSSEHKAIGDASAGVVFARYAGLLPLRDASGRELVTREGRIWTGKGTEGAYLTLGDLVAMYGDFRGSVDALLATSPKDLAGLEDMVRKGLGAHPVTLLKEGVKHYELQLTGQLHFSTEAIRHYVTQHRRALALAGQAGGGADASQAVWRALHEEAFGFHALTDIFAPGHSLVDRRKSVEGILSGTARVRALPQNPLCGFAGIATYVGGGLDAWADKLAHDAVNAAGAELTNLRGTTWTAYGDQKYATQSSEAQALPVQALTASLSELFSAVEAARASKPPATPAHEALTYVPIAFRRVTYRPNPLAREQTLCDRPAACDLLQRSVVEHFLGRGGDAQRPATADLDCEDVQGRLRKACRWVTKKLSEAFEGAKLLACKAGCRARHPISTSAYEKCRDTTCRVEREERSAVCE